MPHTDAVTREAAELLGRAQSLVGAARVLLGGEAPGLPLEAADAALRAAEGYQSAKRRVSALLAELKRALRDELEAAINNMSAEALNVGWQIGTGGQQ